MTDAPHDDEFVEISTAPPPAEAEPQPGENQQDIDKSADTPPAEGEEVKDKPQGDDEKPSDDDEQLRDDKGRYKSGAEARIGELTRKFREAERAAEYWKGLATHDGAQNGEPAAPTSKPTPDDYEDYGEYVEALTDWKTDQRAKQDAAKNAETATQAAQEFRQAEWGERIGAVKATIPDFDAVMEKADTPTLPHVASAIMDADRGPELLYHLAQNPGIVERLNEMTPNRAAMELGRIEAALAEPAKPAPLRNTTTTKAPAPITPITPGASTTADPAKMDQAAYNKWRAEQLKR